MNPYAPPEPAEPLIAQIVPTPPWGPWATLGWGLLAAAAFVAVQTALTLVFFGVEMARDPQQDLATLETRLQGHGLLIALATLLANPAAMIVCGAAIWVRRCTVREYLAIERCSRRDLLIGLICIAVFIPLSDALTWLSGRPIVPEFMISAWQTAGFLPLLIAALVVAAPVGEELFFRGFLYRGWSASRLGPAGAIVLTAVLWAVIHLQYDWFHVGHIVAIGLLFGWLRHTTGSTPLTILLHALMNLVATLEAAVQVAWSS